VSEITQSAEHIQILEQDGYEVSVSYVDCCPEEARERIRLRADTNPTLEDNLWCSPVNPAYPLTLIRRHPRTRPAAQSQEMTNNLNDKNSDTAKLLALTNEWTDAINGRDRQKLDALMASDFALYHWNGVLAAPRLQWLDNLFNHIKITKNTLTDAAPQVYRDFGLVTSVGDWIGSFDGKPFASKCIVVDTWSKIDNYWKVVRRTSHCYAEDSVEG
jgi:hypothetical protein